MLEIGAVILESVALVWVAIALGLRGRFPKTSEVVGETGIILF